MKFGGHTESFTDENGRYRTRWIPEQLVLGVPYDTPILGYGVNNANFLRLWCAQACESFDFQAFNVGNYYKAVEQKMISENITKVLYPNDEAAAGRRLRLQQQYFFVSCSLQDMIRLFRQRENDLSMLPDKFVAQLNDTHPALAVAELMRLLVDEYLMDWEPAWTITTRIFAYTNHTLLPEALETWPAPLMHQLLPRLLEIIFEINRRFLDNVVRPRTHNGETISRLSLIAETGEKYIRMANLACVGSHAINGVAELHTELLKKTVLKDFHDLWPEKFTNITNGVTPRRFMVLSNPGQTRLLCETIGDKWIRDLNYLTGLEPFADDSQFRKQWAMVQLAAKHRLAGMILKTTGISVDPDSMFDVQVKRIHEYKRQHLNVLHVLTRYRRIKQGLAKNIPARTFIFGGKAAPGYAMAKLIIRLIHAAADLINNDPDVADLMKVVFYPDFNVKNAQSVYPAADLSEQISTAGKEASGTGNMKFSLNGALTIGTLDGANVEIRESVGPKNFFLFGLTADQVEKSWADGYIPMERYTTHAELRGVIDMIAGGELFPQEPALFKPLVDSLLYRDTFMVLADYDAYVKCQDSVDQKFLDQQDWLRMSILNVARMGKFSSDRSIAEYNQKIWGVQPVNVKL